MILRYGLRIMPVVCVNFARVTTSVYNYFLGIRSMTVLLRLYLKLDSQALTLCVQMPVLIFTPDGRTVTTPWSLCCVHAITASITLNTGRPTFEFVQTDGRTDRQNSHR